MHTTKIYIAGPMTGLPDFNYPAFNEAAAMLRAQGYQVENPAENPVPACGTWQGYMRNALAQMVHCDTVYVLPGWMGSKGARVELRTAYDLGLTIQFAPDALLEKPGVHAVRELIHEAADPARNATKAEVWVINTLLDIASHGLIQPLQITPQGVITPVIEAKELANRVNTLDSYLPPAGPNTADNIVSRARAALSGLLNRTTSGHHPIYINPFKTDPVAEIRSANHDSAEFGERAIYQLRDINGFDYSTQLYAAPKNLEA